MAMFMKHKFCHISLQCISFPKKKTNLSYLHATTSGKFFLSKILLMSISAPKLTVRMKEMV